MRFQRSWTGRIAHRQLDGEEQRVETLGDHGIGTVHSEEKVSVYNGLEEHCTRWNLCRTEVLFPTMSAVSTPIRRPTVASFAVVNLSRHAW